MKIAFCMINCNRCDGSARAVNEVTERLADRGHDVHLFARKAEDSDLQRVRWHRVPGFGWPEVADFLSYYLMVNRYLSAFRSPLSTSPFDIIHSIGCNAPRADVITIQNVQPAKRKILERLSANERISPARRLTRMLYLRATSLAERRLYTHRENRRPPLFLPVSKGAEAELRAHYDIGPAPVRVIPNAADTAIFRPLSGDLRNEWRARHGFSPTDFLCIFSGGEWARKGLEDAIQAMAALNQPEVRLFVAGDDPDRERFRKLTSDLGLSRSVTFGGFRRDIATALSAADVFLFPSWYEAFSLATIEAAACGLPVVATRINGTADFIQPGVTGQFIEQDSEHIASVLRPLLSDLNACRRMGANARRLVEERYTWDRVAAMTEAAYTEYLENSARS